MGGAPGGPSPSRRRCRGGGSSRRGRWAGPTYVVFYGQWLLSPSWTGSTYLLSPPPALSPSLSIPLSRSLLLSLFSHSDVHSRWVWCVASSAGGDAREGGGGGSASPYPGDSGDPGEGAGSGATNTGGDGVPEGGATGFEGAGAELPAKGKGKVVDKLAKPFLLSEGLPPVPGKLVARILKGDFVDMAELLRDNLEAQRKGVL